VLFSLHNFTPGYRQNMRHKLVQLIMEFGIILRCQGAFRPGVSDRELYKTRHTVERFFAHIKEHKRLIARFGKLDATFFFFFALRMPQHI